MARTNRQPEEDSADSGSWIVTFSDCMTLLLCFFVMLLSFSSFDEESRTRLTGAFNKQTWTSILTLRHNPRSAVVPPVDKPFDRTEEGSELPTEDIDLTMKAKNPFLLEDNDAFRDRRVFRIPVSKMFWGSGATLKPSGRGYLDLIAKFARKMPCLLVVGESSSAGGLEGGEIGLQRACAVLEYLAEQGGLSSERLNISARSQARAAKAGPAVMEITLLARSIYE